jgi:hypothetical protein
MSIQPSYYFEEAVRAAVAVVGAGELVMTPVRSLRTLLAGNEPSSPDHKIRINMITSHS